MFPSVFLLFSLASAISLPHDHHEHSARRSLPGGWFQKRDHPVHNLFKRAATDGIEYAEVGSPEWRNAYPDSADTATRSVPKAWSDALQAAIDAGNIPNIPQATNTPQTNPTYPDGMNPNGPEICSSTYKCRHEDDIWDAPDGFFGTGFDDGPQPVSDILVQFLEQNNERATHFLIGVNIRDYPEQFMTIFNSGNDIAVHTYSHPYMTTLSNLEIVAQLGWTMELIHNSTGGRVPKFWRPPFGDSDNRVRAIALQVFGLELIAWNRDTDDWSLTTGGTTMERINSSMTEWLTGPKSPGLIVLEHELSDQSVQAFIDAYPVIKQNGWNMLSVAEFADGDSAYQNADSADLDKPVESKGILLSEDDSDNDESSASSESSPNGTPTSSSSSSTASSTRSSTSSSSSSQASSQSANDNSAIQLLSGTSILTLTVLLSIPAAFSFL